MTSEAASPQAGAVRPLVVDLDGTLVPTDLLWESLCSVAGRHPLSLLLLPFWLLRGRASFKAEVTKRASVDVTLLPYREDVLALLRERREQGGEVVLATAADEPVARQVADHLKLFTHVIASDGRRNCKGRAKVEAIREKLGNVPFDYVGDSNADIPVVAAAASAWLVEPTSGLLRAAEAEGKLRGVLRRPGRPASAAVRLLRPRHWAKNALVFIPLLAAHRFRDKEALVAAAIAFACFSLAASAIYVWNDLCDLDSDRAHPRKRKRPMAACELPIPTAILIGIVLLAGCSALAAAAISPLFCAAIWGYVFLTLAYSMWIKRKVFVDVLVLSGLYSYRIAVGGLATSIVLSHWLIVFSMFFFLSLALAKRYCELDAAASKSANRHRGYRLEDLDLLRTIGPVSGYLAVLVMAFYVNSEATRMYPRRDWLWLVCPVLLYWITRIWFLAHRKEMNDDPVVFAFRDVRSLLCGLAAAAIVAVASYAG